MRFRLILTRITLRLMFGLIILGCLTLIQAQPANAGYDSNNLIDDYAFTNYGSMDQNAIQAFLQARGSYLASYTDPTVNQPAAKIIRDAAWDFGLNPQVIMATMQKEQSLITNPSPTASNIRSAMGYGCPDGADCNTQYYGLYNQVRNGSWQLRFNYERSGGNNSTWTGPSGAVWGNPSISYACAGSSRYYSAGLYPGRTVTFYAEGGPSQPYAVVTIANRATASMYCYTPHVYNPSGVPNYYSGSYNFVTFYEQYFGSTISGLCLTAAMPSRVGVSMRKYVPRVDTGVFTIFQGASTNCVESHTWNSGFASWRAHEVSNQPGLDPDNNTIAYEDLNGDGKDEPIAIGFRNTGSGKVEFHVWNYDMKSWIVNTPTNLASINPANMTLQFASLAPNRVKEPVAIGVQNTSTGMVEFHYWNKGLQTWRTHVISNLPTNNPANSLLRFGDLNGDGVDEAIAIGTTNTSTGMVEFHTWNPGLYSWANHTASNLPTVNMANCDIQFADVNGDGRDEAVLICFGNTGSGRIEFHVWNPGFTSWKSHSASNQPVVQ